MAKKLNLETESLHEQALALIKAVKKSEDSKKKDEVKHTVTVITEEDRGLLICGSAHQMTDMFVELMNKRPEFRQVLDDAIKKYGYSNHWKL